MSDELQESPKKELDLRVHISRVGKFLWRVVKHFTKNKGLLLAGAVGYNALLSVIPLFAIILVISSKFIETRRLMEIVSAEIRLVFPGQAGAVTEVLESFVAQSTLLGGIGFLVLLFFSSIAFRMLEDAMAVIFRHHRWEQERHPLISALIAFVYILSIGLAVFFLTLMTALLDTVAGDTVEILRWQLSVEAWSAALVKVCGFLGMVILLASFYHVMPVAKVRFKLALVGGTFAAVLWEGVRTFLVWYFENISLVNVVYGSLATVIIVLLSMEVAAVIVLLGAQMIADIEKSSEAGLPWYEEAPTQSKF